jgi:Ring finger domain
MLEQQQRHERSSTIVFATPNGFRLTTTAAFLRRARAAAAAGGGTGNATMRMIATPHTSSLRTAHDLDAVQWILHLGPHLVTIGAPSTLGLSNGGGGPQFVVPSGESRRERSEEAKARRGEYVHQCLIHKRVVESSMPTNTKQSSTNEAMEKSDIAIVVVPAVDEEEQEGESNRGDAGESSSSRPSCAICLKDYVLNDRICWSQNRRCCHHFHRECVEEWLMRHDQCPFCRETYVVARGSPPPLHVPPVGEERNDAWDGTIIDRGGARVEILRRPQDGDFSEMLVGIEQFYRQAYDLLRFDQPFVLNTMIQDLEIDMAGVAGFDEEEDDLAPSLELVAGSNDQQQESAAVSAMASRNDRGNNDDNDIEGGASIDSH